MAFDPKVIPGSCDKLRTVHWAELYKIIRKISPALAEVIEVYKKGKPRLVSLDVLKEFRGDNNSYGYPNDPLNTSTLVREESIEFPSISMEPLSVDPSTPLPRPDEQA